MLIGMTTPVLDLRPFANREVDYVHGMVVTPTPDRPRVLSGTAHGFVIEAQGSIPFSGRSGALIRITAPDGRVVNLLGHRREPDHDLKRQVADNLSPAIRAVLTHRRLSPARAAAGAAALARTVAATERCLSEGVRGTAALIRVAAAAEGLDPALVAMFDTVAPFNESRFGRGEVCVWQVARMIRCGLSVEDATSWFGPLLRVPAAREFDQRMKVIEAFQSSGWTTAQVRTMEGFETGRALEVATVTGQPYTGFADADVSAWSVMSWADAALALNAGLSGRVAARLWQSGEWDAATLTTLGVLRREMVAS